MKDLTKGNILTGLIAFTLPLLMGNFFQVLYNTADTLIVGQTLGKDALASVGATGSINFLIVGFAQGMTAGLTILTAQRFGAKDELAIKNPMSRASTLQLRFLFCSAYCPLFLWDLCFKLCRPQAKFLKVPRPF